MLLLVAVVAVVVAVVAVAAVVVAAVVAIDAVNAVVVGRLSNFQLCYFCPPLFYFCFQIS